MKGLWSRIVGFFNDFTEDSAELFDLARHMPLKYRIGVILIYSAVFLLGMIVVTSAHWVLGLFYEPRPWITNFWNSFPAFVFSLIFLDVLLWVKLRHEPILYVLGVLPPLASGSPPNQPD